MNATRYNTITMDRCSIATQQPVAPSDSCLQGMQRSLVQSDCLHRDALHRHRRRKQLHRVLHVRLVAALPDGLGSSAEHALVS
jgi:hypothetical protein